MASEYEIIFSRRHPQIETLDVIWNMIFKAYRGGIEWQNGGYLFKHAKESDTSFAARKKRAVYFNQVQPLADLLSGFLFIRPPARKNTEIADWLIFNADKKRKTIDEFMKVVATYSLLFTCGVLVDSPNFNPEQYPTMKSRKDSGLNPYCVFYYPFDIIDFHINSIDGKLDWVILDNSYYDNTDPLVEGTTRTIRRLWTREYYQDFEKLPDGVDEIEVGQQIGHPIGEVPFKFINWKDDDGDFIAESVFEDIAMISRLIYNKMSEMDEMLANGSFRVLMYPTVDGKLPASLVAGGIGGLSAIPYDGNLSKEPKFDGAKLEEVEPFLKAIEFYIAEILKKIGLDTDETKDYVKSGLSKKIDFQKVRTLLTFGSMSLSALEAWMFVTAAKWSGVSESRQVEVHYSTQYADEDIQLKVELLNELLIHPFKKLRTAVTSLLVKHLLTGELPQSEIDEIYKEIESGYGSGKAMIGMDDKAVLNGSKLAADEQAADDLE